MPDFVARTDAGLIAQTRLFHDKVVRNEAVYGIAAADLTTLDTLITAAEASMAAQSVKQAELRAATTQKVSDLDALEAKFREQAAVAREKPGITETELQSAGLEAPDTEPTPVGPPTTRPVAVVDTSQRLEHRIEFVDETSTTTGKKAKPIGVRGAQIWVKIDGPPPIDLSQCRFLAEDTATPYLASFAGADAGKTAHYILCWVNTKGEPGPLGETVSATITA